MTDPDPEILAEAVSRLADARFDETVARLSRYLEIPAISCEPEHAGDVHALAGLIAEDLRALGLADARVLELDDALPSVAASWMGAGEQAPTVLIYGHLDLQPVMRENWHTEPHEAVQCGVMA